MVSLIIVIITLVSLQNYSLGLMVENTYIKSGTDGKLCISTGYLSFGTTRSVRGCSVMCDIDTTCLSFFFNKLTKVCLGSSQILTDLTLCVDVPEVVYFTKDMRVWEPCSSDAECPIEFTSCGDGSCKCAVGMIPSSDFKSCAAGTTNHGAICTSNTDCYGDAVECWDGTCICKPGYSFQPRDKTCRTSCAAFGTTFSIYIDYTLACSGSSIHNNVTPLDCEDICQNTDCRSIRYNHRYSQCKTDVCTVLTNPNDFMPINGVDLYIRNCAPDLK